MRAGRRVGAKVCTAGRRQLLTKFFFWTSWAAATNRPGTTITYTNNWPHEPLIGNVPSAANVLWSIASVILLLAGVGALAWWMAFRRDADDEIAEAPASDPFTGLTLTPSMKAVAIQNIAVWMCHVRVRLYGRRFAIGMPKNAWPSTV